LRSEKIVRFSSFKKHNARCLRRLTEWVCLRDKKYAEELRKKVSIFRVDTKQKKTLFLTMIITFGLAKNQYSNSLVQQSLTMSALFKE